MDEEKEDGSIEHDNEFSHEENYFDEIDQFDFDENMKNEIFLS